MSIETVTMYRVICERCGRTAQDGDYSAWESEESALLEASESDWLIRDDGHWCGDCLVWDEVEDELVPTGTPVSA